MSRRLFGFILLLSISSLSFPSFATKIIHYKHMPITVDLRVGEERSIQFGDHVQVGVTIGQQKKRLFRVQSAQGVIHILPHQEFDKQRIQVKRMTDGVVILIDLVAKKSKGKPLESIKLLLEEENKVEDTNNTVQEKRVVTPVDLTRYAAQRLFGPSRLHKPFPGIRDASITNKGAVRVFKGANKHQVHSKAIAAYSGNGYHLVALLLKNISNQKITLNYLDINLPFTHATFQHHSLDRRGKNGDSTVLYLVFDEPLKDALYPWTYYQDKDIQE